MSTTSAAKARAKAMQAAVAEVTPDRPLTPEEMELLGIEPPEDKEDGPEDKEDEPEEEEGLMVYSQLWRGGRGVKQYYVVADSEEEAIAKLIEKDSILGAIGCSAELVDNIDGYTIVAAK